MLFLPFLFLFLVSCSDNLLYTEATPHIFIDILNRSDTVSVNSTIRFQARINPSVEDVDFIWIIEKKDSTNYKIRNFDLLFENKFSASGLYNVKFSAKDRFFDAYEDSLFIRVSNLPVCDGLSVEIFQGSPTFKWNCIDKDNADGKGSLTYNFLLFDKYGIKTDTTLTKESLQLGYALQENDIIRLIAMNKYGIKVHMDSVWSLP